MTAIAPHPAADRWRARRVVSLWLPGDAPEESPVRPPGGPGGADGEEVRCLRCKRPMRRYTPSGLGPVCEAKLRPRATIPAPRPRDVPHIPGQDELPLALADQLAFWSD